MKMRNKRIKRYSAVLEFKNCFEAITKEIYILSIPINKTDTAGQLPEKKVYNIDSNESDTTYYIKI